MYVYNKLIHFIFHTVTHKGTDDINNKHSDFGNISIDTLFTLQCT